MDRLTTADDRRRMQQHVRDCFDLIPATREEAQEIPRKLRDLRRRWRSRARAARRAVWAAGWRVLKARLAYWRACVACAVDAWLRRGR